MRHRTHRYNYPRARSRDQDLAGRLLFSRFDESTHTFLSTHVSRADGGGETEVAMPGPEGGGRWSWSGDAIAVMTVLPDDRIGTAIIKPDGTIERVLDIPDASLNLVCTVWSPDDQRLACEGFDETHPSRNGIYTVRSSDGGGLVRLTKTPTNHGRPARRLLARRHPIAIQAHRRRVPRTVDGGANRRRPDASLFRTS